MRTNIFETKNKYNVIYADPPWEYKQSGLTKNARGIAKKHYATMPTSEIAKLPIPKISKENALCFMWATFPNIDQALDLMKAWGFEYKTAAFVWVKKNKKANTNFWGMGAYTRANAEVCLLGIKKGTRAGEVVKRRTSQKRRPRPSLTRSLPPQTAIWKRSNMELKRLVLTAGRK